MARRVLKILGIVLFVFAGVGLFCSKTDKGFVFVLVLFLVGCVAEFLADIVLSEEKMNQPGTT